MNCGRIGSYTGGTKRWPFERKVLIVGVTSPLHSLTAQLASLVQMKINREGVKVVGGLILLILALVVDILLYRYGHQLRHWLGGL
jgi:hypothetical protein